MNFICITWKFSLKFDISQVALYPENRILFDWKAQPKALKNKLTHFSGILRSYLRPQAALLSTVHFNTKIVYFRLASQCKSKTKFHAYQTQLFKALLS